MKCVLLAAGYATRLYPLTKNKPKSDMAVPSFYIYKADTLKLIKKYLEEGNNPDAPGNFIPWLIKNREVYAFKFEGERYDIGTFESYEAAQKIFG